jgi:hypothetical protein
LILFLYIGSSTILIPFLLGIIFWRNLKLPQKYFFYFIVFSMGVEIIASYIARTGGVNIFIFNYFLIADLLFFVVFFYYTSKYPKWLLWLTAILFIFLPFWQFYIQEFYYNPKLEPLFYIIIFFYFIIQSRQGILNEFDNLEISPFKNYKFWIYSARMIYYLFIIFIYIYPSFLENGYENNVFATASHLINGSANIILNIMYGLSFYEKTKPMILENKSAFRYSNPFK